MNTTRHDNLTRLTARLAVLALVMLFAMSFACAARADSVRLRGEAAVARDEVRLGDVAELSGTDVEMHALLTVAQWPAVSERTAVTLDTVRDALARAGVNLARVTFSGRLTCDVRRAARGDVVAGMNATSADMNAEVNSGSASTPSAEPASANGPMVRDLLVDLLVGMAGAVGVTERDDLRMSFNDPAGVLDRPTRAGRFEFEPLATAIPGRVPVMVRQYDGERLAEQARVHVDIERRYQAVVAQRRIPRGQVLGGEDVALADVFARGGAEPITSLDDVMGQVATGTLQAGDALAGGDVEAPRLVRRGDEMTVRCIVGNLVIRLTATALEDGGRDQMIRVRNTNSRETFVAKVVGPHEAELNRDAADAANSGDMKDTAGAVAADGEGA